MTRPALTSMLVGEQSAGKPLGKFGCKVVRKPVPEGRAVAERDADPRQSRAA